MNRVVQKLLARDESHITAWNIIRWWEVRRIPYNLIVGLTGLVTFAVAVFAGLVVETTGHEPIFPDPPIAAVLGVIVYGIAANVMYTSGWVSELVIGRFWPVEAPALGRLCFAAGLIGSIMLTLAPSVLVVLLSLIRVSYRHLS